MPFHDALVHALSSAVELDESATLVSITASALVTPSAEARMLSGLLAVPGAHACLSFVRFLRLQNVSGTTPAARRTILQEDRSKRRDTLMPAPSSLAAPGALKSGQA